MSSVEKQKLHFGAVFLSQAFKNQIIQTLYDSIKQKDIDFQDVTDFLQKEGLF